ncbi:MAG TPA: holo-ACP synthase [Chloroflexi bacterium]|jgi:holo-[acyl-carrier-protein] synthase|nr:holo-ACP synthase [Chloroflexota bacterium]
MIKSGIDLVRTNRLAEVDPKIRERFLARVFTPAEQEQARGNFETLSGIFAAKEAVSKALGTGIGKVAWQDIEILHEPSGEPLLYLHNYANELAEIKGLKQWSVSITHDGGMAAAVAVAIGEIA